MRSTGILALTLLAACTTLGACQLVAGIGDRTLETSADSGSSGQDGSLAPDATSGSGGSGDSGERPDAAEVDGGDAGDDGGAQVEEESADEQDVDDPVEAR